MSREAKNGDVFIDPNDNQILLYTKDAIHSHITCCISIDYGNGETYPTFSTSRSDRERFICNLADIDWVEIARKTGALE